MPAYLIAEHKITDPIKFDEYRTKVGPMIAKHGGRYLTLPIDRRAGTQGDVAASTRQVTRVE